MAARIDARRRGYSAKDPLDVALGEQFINQQRVDRRKLRTHQEAEKKFKAELAAEARDEDSEYLDLDVKVNQRDMLGTSSSRWDVGAENWVFFGGDFDAEGVALGLDPAWYAVTPQLFEEMIIYDKDFKFKNQVDKKHVRALEAANNALTGKRVFLVRGQSLLAYFQRDIVEEDSAESALEDLVKDFERKIRAMSGQIVSGQNAAVQYLSRHKDQREKLEDFVQESRHYLGSKLRFKPFKDRGCDMVNDTDYQSRWTDENQLNLGTPKHPRPEGNIAAQRERRENRWHAALMVLDSDLKGLTCVSPELEGRGIGGTNQYGEKLVYAEEQLPQVYHDMTRVVNLGKKHDIKDEFNKTIPEEQVFGDMAFCAQHGHTNQERCEDSSKVGKYPLSDRTKLVGSVCEYVDDDDFEGCAPRWLKNAPKEYKDLYQSPDGFFLNELAYVEDHLRKKMLGTRNMTRKEKRKLAKVESRKKAHRIVNDDSQRENMKYRAVYGAGVQSRRRKARRN